jgi:hypothetical protein
MTTPTQVVGAPRDDLAAAQLGIEPVPERHRVLGFLDYFVLWADLGVGLLVLLAGTLLVPGLGFWPALAAIVLGTVAGVLLLGLAGVVGSDHGIPSMIGLRPSFGLRGSYPPSLVDVIQLVRFGALEVIIPAQASARLATPRRSRDLPSLGRHLERRRHALGLGGPLVVVRQWLEKAGIWIVLASADWMVIQLAAERPCWREMKRRPAGWSGNPEARVRFGKRTGRDRRSRGKAPQAPGRMGAGQPRSLAPDAPAASPARSYSIT